jgi:hypothetical protein
LCYRDFGCEGVSPVVDSDIVDAADEDDVLVAEDEDAARANIAERDRLELAMRVIVVRFPGGVVAKVTNGNEILADEADAIPPEALIIDQLPHRCRERPSYPEHPGEVENLAVDLEVSLTVGILLERARLDLERAHVV